MVGMCGRFVLRAPAEELSSLLEVPIQFPLPLPPRYNIAPTQTIAAVRCSPQTGQREWVVLRWGLVPAWSRELDTGLSLINARAETVATKPFFRDAYRRRRCLIPASGFYEWKRTDKKTKQPYYFQRRDGQPFCFAGLWERWARNGVAVESCALVTTEANAVVAPVHDRMPVMLLPEEYEQWLSASTTDAVESLLRPLPAEEMTAHPVSPRVNSPHTDEPALVAPLNSA